MKPFQVVKQPGRRTYDVVSVHFTPPAIHEGGFFSKAAAQDCADQANDDFARQNAIADADNLC